MNQAALSPLRRRDRNLLLASFLALVLLAWAYLCYLNYNMIGMHAGLRPWTAIEFLPKFLMWAMMLWAVMMVGSSNHLKAPRYVSDDPLGVC